MENKYDFKTAEKEMQDLWKANEIYRFQNGKEKKVFSIDTPPPTVSGSLHIGHVFSYTQAEMIARFKRMQGYDVYYPFGFDDNGLPTERLVEKEEKLRARELSGSEFRKKCMAVSEKYEDEFKRMWESLGLVLTGIRHTAPYLRIPSGYHSVPFLNWFKRERLTAKSHRCYGVPNARPPLHRQNWRQMTLKVLLTIWSFIRIQAHLP